MTWRRRVGLWALSAMMGLTCFEIGRLAWQAVS